MRSEGGLKTAEPEHGIRVAPRSTQVLDALELAVVALDRESRVVYNNRRIEELLGIEAGALLGAAGARAFPGADARWLKGASREMREFRFETEDRELTL